MSYEFVFLTRHFFQQGHIFYDPKTFLLLWQKLKWQKISIWKCELFLILICKNLCHLNSLHWQYEQYLSLSDKHYRTVFKWQKYFQIK